MNCDYGGNAIYSFSHVSSEEDCQTICFEMPGSDYFLFYTSSGKCECLERNTKNCDLLMGPSDPPIEDCTS